MFAGDSLLNHRLKARLKESSGAQLIKDFEIGFKRIIFMKELKNTLIALINHSKISLQYSTSLVALLVSTSVFASTYSDTIASLCTLEGMNFFHASRESCIYTAKQNANFYQKILHNITLKAKDTSTNHLERRAFIINQIDDLSTRIKDQASFMRIDFSNRLMPELNRTLVEARTAANQGKYNRILELAAQANTEFKSFKNELY